MPLVMAVALMFVQSVEKKDLLGAWQRTDESPDQMVRFEATRFINVGKDYRQIFPVVYEKGKVFIVVEGQRQELHLSLKEGKLTVKQQDNTETYKKLATVPPELDFSPLKLGTVKPLPADKVKAVQAELAKRIEEDQAVRKDPARQKDMAAVDGDNTTWLRALVLDVGWIDVKRFGRETASKAFLIVQHSGDLRLMQGALPEIEKDMRAGVGDPQDYALLYDRLKLKLGERQRYGSQFGQNDKGETVIFPLEDKAKVEEFRKAIGLFPLSQYIAIIKQQTGKQVKIQD
jgi:hypothetical protein